MRKGTKINTIYNTYRIIEKIGEGGNGTVFKVKDLDDKLFALKIVDQKKLSREKLKRFKNEINFCEKHEHPNIIKVIDKGLFTDKSTNYIFYIMPLYDSSLRSIINSKLQGERIVKIFNAICNGLEYAQDNDCIHRDLKPENILINLKNDEIVIADFGIAHFANTDKITTDGPKKLQDWRILHTMHQNKRHKRLYQNPQTYLH